MYCYVYLFFFAVTMAKRYSTKEACEILMNDEFSESDSEDSLDYEIGSDSSSTVSYSEVDSDPENDFSGRKISISKQDATTTTRGRQLTLGRGNVTTTSRGRVRTRGGRGVQSLSRGSRARGRGATTRGGTIRRNGQSIDQNDNSNANTTGLPAVSDKEGSNAEESNTSDDDATSKEEEGDDWTKNNPSVQNFVFNEESGMNTDVPENASPVYFFELLLTEQFIQDLVTKNNEYAEKTIDASRPLSRRSNLADWKDVTIDEMRKFIGIVFAMGLVLLPSYKEYWSRDPIYKNHFF